MIKNIPMGLYDRIYFKSIAKFKTSLIIEHVETQFYNKFPTHFRFYKSLPKHYVRDHQFTEEEAHYKSQQEKMAKDPLRSKIVKVRLIVFYKPAVMANPS